MPTARAPRPVAPPPAEAHTAAAASEPTGAAPAALDRYVRALTPAHDHLLDQLQRLLRAAEVWNGGRPGFGGRLDEAHLAALDRASRELAHLDLWVGRVADAFRAADRYCPAPGCGPVLRAPDTQIEAAGPPELSAAVAAGAYDHLFDVVRDGSDGGTRLVRLDLDRAPVDLPALGWRLVAGALGLTGAGPLHVVVHGWGTGTGRALAAAGTTADLHDQQGGGDATVLVVDWDAGAGTSTDWWALPSDFRAARRSAVATAATLAPLLGAVTEGPRPVLVTAHSLGAEVVARALTEVGGLGAAGRSGIDLLLVQPALPASGPEDEPGAYGGLTAPVVRNLTVTVNPGDDALYWYERQGPPALGDEAPDGAGLTALVARRRSRRLTTEVVHHRSSAGRGHLGLRPDGRQPLVRSLTQELIDRARTGRPSGQAAVRRWLYATHGGRADALMTAPELRRLLDRRQREGRSPTVVEVEVVVDDLLRRWAAPPPGHAAPPTGTTTTVVPPVAPDPAPDGEAGP